MSESAGNEISCRQVQKKKLSQKTVWVGMCHLNVEQIIYIYIWIKIEYQEPHEAEKTVWVGMCHLSVEQIYIYIYIYMDKNRIPRTPRDRENGLGGHVPS